MLESLFGNKNVSRILLFLFVNGKCYGTQLQRAFDTALTPIQKALQRLEKGGVIISFYEGKTRVYQFNPAYPVLNELELFLKKTYTLLPSYEKKMYYILKHENLVTHLASGKKELVVRAFWERLKQVKQLIFYAKTRSKEETGWHGKGKAEVLVSKEQAKALIFTEKGSWNNQTGGEFTFSNIFRWSLDHDAHLISLEHLRHGIDKPVFLFHLVPTGNQSMSSIDSHLCEGDAYFGQISLDQNGLRLNWRVIGPKKDEEIDYYYF